MVTGVSASQGPTLHLAGHLPRRPLAVASCGLVATGCRAGRRARRRWLPSSSLAALGFLVQEDKLALARGGRVPVGLRWLGHQQGAPAPQLCSRRQNCGPRPDPEEAGRGGQGQSRGLGLCARVRWAAGQSWPPGLAERLGPGPDRVGRLSFPLVSPPGAAPSRPHLLPLRAAVRGGPESVSAGHTGTVVSLRPRPGQVCGPSAASGGKAPRSLPTPTRLSGPGPRCTGGEGRGLARGRQRWAGQGRCGLRPAHASLVWGSGWAQGSGRVVGRPSPGAGPGPSAHPGALQAPAGGPLPAWASGLASTGSSGVVGRSPRAHPRLSPARACAPRSRSISGASSGLSTSPLSSPRVSEPPTSGSHTEGAWEGGPAGVPPAVGPRVLLPPAGSGCSR